MKVGSKKLKKIIPPSKISMCITKKQIKKIFVVFKIYLDTIKKFAL